MPTSHSGSKAKADIVSVASLSVCAYITKPNEYSALQFLWNKLLLSLFQDEKLRSRGDIPLSYIEEHAVANSHWTFMEDVLISVDRFHTHRNLSTAFTSASKEQKVQTLNYFFYC